MPNYAPMGLADLRDALSFIDPEAPTGLEAGRSGWVRIAMAIKSEFPDGDGFEAFEAWSQQGASYRKDSCRDTWRSIKAGGSVTIGTLIDCAVKGGWRQAERSEAEQRRLAREQSERRERAARQRELDAAAERRWHDVVAEAAYAIWTEFGQTVGESLYLIAKGVGAHGVRFLHRGLIVATHEDFAVRYITGKGPIDAFFRQPEAERPPFFYLKPGVLMVPVATAEGVIRNLQFIWPTGKKRFMRNGRKSGLMHVIGAVSPRAPLCVAEGYATGATIHEATGYPVALAWDAGNLLPVAQALRAAYPAARLVICADNDVGTKGNPGVTQARAAAEAVGGVAVAPSFAKVAAHG